MGFKTMLSVVAAAVLAAGPAHAITYTENFDTADFAGWTTRWFGANSNALPFNPFDLSQRGTNQTGLSLTDGDFGPDGQFNSTATNIAFDAGFGATLTSFAFDLISYNEQTLTVYDKDGVTIFSAAVTPEPFDANDPFPQSAYNRYTVNSTNGIGGFRFGPFGSDFNVGIDNLVAISAVPEPAAWALMIGGFGLVGGTLRRSRGRIASA